MEMTYGEASKILDHVLVKVNSATRIPVKRDDFGTDGNFQHNPYHMNFDGIIVGALSMAVGRKSGFVSYVDCASMCKQCLHEYRHWQQRHLYLGETHDPGEYGFLAMPFEDGSFCRTMARQMLVAEEFPAYREANQFCASYELDAEEYAIRAAPAVLKAAGFPEALIEPCLKIEIDRRYNWYGDRPVASLGAAAENLRDKKLHLDRIKCPSDYAPDDRHPVATTFLSDVKACAEYESMGAEEGEKFLFDYVAKHDPKIFGMYPIIRDEMPKLTAVEKLHREAYRLRNGLFDEDQYDGPDGP